MKSGKYAPGSGGYESRLNEILTDVPALVWEAWGKPDAKAQRINYVSPYAETMTGYPVQVWIDTPNFWLQIVHPEDRESAASDTEIFFAKGGTGTKRFRWVTKDGRTIWVEAFMRVILDDNGKPAGLRGVTVDVTERHEAAETLRRTEKALQQSQEMLRQMQKMDALGRLAGSMAHDFNNLLTAISGYGQLLLDDMEITDPRREDVKEILLAAGRGAELTGRLLTFSRRKSASPKPVSLNQVVRGLEKMFGRLIGESIRMNLDLAPDLPLIMADPAQIEQALLNLLVNARDAMPEGGWLSVETKHVRLDEELESETGKIQTGAYVSLGVRDTGSGMTEELRKRIFEPFFTTRKAGKGTGLGLPIVYGIVSQNHGHIRVESVPGKGTEVTVYFPAASDPPAVSRAAASQRITRTGSGTILLVEDEQPVLNFLKRLLSGAGYTVLTAADGEEGLRLFRERADAIHLVITDVVMPKMWGPRMIGRLREISPGVKVLYVSGYTAEVALEDLDAPFLSKPIQSDEFLEKIRRILQDSPSDRPPAAKPA
jgi:two-component system, cell cycle sensor histidine kinase and response regulator CckA